MTELDLQNRFVENLKRIRKTQKLTQEKLAEKAGLSEQIINDIEGGRRWPRRTTLSKITDALGIDVQELFASTEFVPNSNSNLPSKFVEELKNSFDEILKKYNDV